MKAAVLFFAGLVFGGGLLLSGMVEPQKVIGFLDVSGGAWDPSLAFVMLGAIGVFAVLNALIHRRTAPVLGGEFPGPRASGSVNTRVILGAALFGVGWGLAGVCPGPALTALASLRPEAGVFVAAMLVGMLLAQRGFGADAPKPEPAPPSAP